MRGREAKRESRRKIVRKAPETRDRKRASEGECVSEGEKGVEDGGRARGERLRESESESERARERERESERDTEDKK